MTANGPSPPPTEAPTRVRYRVLFLVCLLAMITYMDRAMYGSAKDDLMASVGRPVSDFFYILVAFQLAYALFEIPTGWLGDRFGPRSTLLRVVLWWSTFLAFTPVIGLVFPASAEVFGMTVALALLVMIAAEFMFGMGEAGAFPNASKAVYNWFPEDRRAFAKGAVWMSARFMGGLTPFVWVLLTQIAGLSWRQTLWLFAGLAVLWCVAWLLAFRNHPDEHPGTNEAERVLILTGKGAAPPREAVPWGRIFGSRGVWALCLMYMATNYNWYFLMYYLPGTLKSQFPDWQATDAGKLKLALIGGAPLLVGMFGCYLGGVLSDWHIKKTGSRTWGRRATAMVGYGMAGVCYLLAAAFVGADLWLFAGCLILVGFFNDLIMGPAWAASQDIGRRYSAVVGGTMNMVGNLGAALGNLVTGLILAGYTVNGAVQPAGFQTLFLMYGAVYLAGVGTWLLIDPTKPVVGDYAGEPGASAGAR